MNLELAQQAPDLPDNATFTFGVEKYTYGDKPTPARPTTPMFGGSPVAPGRSFFQSTSNWDAISGSLGSTLKSLAAGLSAQIAQNPKIKSVSISMRENVGLSITGKTLQAIQRGTQEAQNKLASLFRASVPSSVNVITDTNINNRTTTDPSQQGTKIQLK